jgi:hypothetical protein
MILKEKWKRGLFAFAVALFLIAASWSVTASAAGTIGTPQYPDLRTLTPSDLHLGTQLVAGQNHYVVEFTNSAWNAGQGPLELHGIPHVPYDGFFDATQWIYEQPTGVTVKPVGTFAFHPSHGHFHFNDFARYELWTQRAFDRAKAANFTTGKPLYVAAKQSFCLLDTFQAGPNAAPVGVYMTCTPLMEGLSVGWADTYDWTLPDQWVDVGQTPLFDGQYVLRSIVDPDNRIYESDNKADPARESQVANSATTSFRIVNGRLGP